MKWLWLALLLLSTSIVAMGENVSSGSGNGLLPQCQAAVDALTDDAKFAAASYDIGYCTGLIHGISDVLESLGTVCPGDGVTGAQRTRVVVKFLNDHPARLNDRDTILVMDALRQAWPCPAKK